MKRYWLLALAMLCITQASYSQTTLRLHVINADTRDGIHEAQITLLPLNEKYSTDALGLCEIKNLAQGAYSLTVMKEGFEKYERQINLSSEYLSLDVEIAHKVYRLAPIDVNAIRATERVSPVTFSEVKSLQIREQYFVQDVPDLLSNLPSTTFYSENGNSIGYSYLSIRGFEQRRLAVMVNGIPQNDPEDHNVYWIDMPDLLSFTENIQVQRGAGSAFYGPPAIGGSINIITSPTFLEPKIMLSSTIGFQEYGDRKQTVLNTRRYGFFVHSGLIDNKYMVFGNLSSINSSGYRNHSWTDLNSYFLGAAYFGENTTTRIHLYGGPLADGLAYYGLPKFYNNDVNLRRMNYNYFKLNASGDTVTYATNSKSNEIENFFQPHYELLHEWRITPTIKLYNTLFYVRGDGFFDYDGDWVWYDNNATTWFRKYVGYDSTYGVTNFNSMLLRGFVSNKQYGWLSRAVLDHDNGSFTFGIEARTHRSVHWGKIQNASIYPTNYDPDFKFYEYSGEKDMFSLYAHDIYRLGDNATLMGNVQLAYNRYGIKNEIFLANDFDLAYLFLNPRLGVNYNFSESMNGYISVSITSREPRLKNLYSAEEAWTGAKPQFAAQRVGETVQYNFDDPKAKPERLYDVEIGGGYSTENLKLNASLFWMEFTDELVKNGQIDIFGNPITGNAERTRHIGIEISTQYMIIDNLNIAGNVTWSNNRLIRFKEFDDVSKTLITLDGNPIAGFPDMLANARLSYRWEKVSAAISTKYVGAFYTDNRKSELNKVDAYNIYDFDLGYELPKDLFGLSVTLRGKIRNVFNKLYISGGSGEKFFPAAERNYFLDVALTL